MNPVPFHDFAGSTVVHTIGGVISLAGAIALGPRLGRMFKRDGGEPMKPHDLIIGATGGLILWFGWYGFNPGSTLSALDAMGIGRVSSNTTLAACAAGLTALLISYYKTEGKWDLRIHGQRLPGRPRRDHLSLLLGRPRRRVSPRNRRGHSSWSAESICSNTCVSTIRSAPFRCTAFAGIWGTLSLGLFAAGKYGAPTATGADASTRRHRPLLRRRIRRAQGADDRQLLDHHGDFRRVDGADVRGQSHRNRLRISTEGEIEGLDIHEHGFPAYPEYVVTGEDGCPKTIDDVPIGRRTGTKLPQDRHQEGQLNRSRVGRLRSGPANFYSRSA